MDNNNKRKIAMVLALAAFAVWGAASLMAPKGNRVLANAFPAKLLASPKSCTTPAWPNEARRYEVEGITLLHFQIDAQGNIQGAEVAKSSSWTMLDDAALQSLVKCKFKPGLKEAEEGVTFPIQFVWTLSGPPSIRPQLVPGSCAKSGRFSGFQGFERAGDGVLVRFLVDADGVPTGVKTEPGGANADAAEYVKTCKFVVDPAMPGEKTDTAYGLVLAKQK
jgi:protein TonB